MKCIFNKCPKYFESDQFDLCSLDDYNLIQDECIGIKNIKPKLEELICKIGIIQTQYNTLAILEDYIKDNQGE